MLKDEKHMSERPGDFSSYLSSLVIKVARHSTRTGSRKRPEQSRVANGAFLLAFLKRLEGNDPLASPPEENLASLSGSIEEVPRESRTTWPNLWF